MSDMSTAESLSFEQLEYGERYFIQTAKNAIESLGHVIAEAGSNEDEAISRRAKRDGEPDEGVIRVAYDPEGMILVVTGDGDGLTAARMRDRLKHVGSAPQQAAKRGFFHRGIREVFLAMGGGEVISIGLDGDGNEVLSQAVFDPHKGMALVVEDQEPTDEQRHELGLYATGTRVRIPMARFATKKPKQYTFGQMEQQIRDCVGLRPVLTDAAREVLFEYGAEPPRQLRFTYPDGEDLIVAKATTIDGQNATLWAKVAAQPLPGGRSRQTRRSGILIRGDRAAYEVTYGEKLAHNPAMRRVFGELRIDSIEGLQREADAKANDESQLVYKTDRSGLNPEHVLVEKVYDYIDEVLGPLVANLESGQEKKQVTPDMRRQLQKIARAINEVLKEDVSEGVDEPEGGTTTAETLKPGETKEPPEPAPSHQRYVEDGIGFASGKIFMEAGKSRTVELWFDSSKVPEGTVVTIESAPDEVMHAATLSGLFVPSPGKDGIAQLDLTLKAGNSEGRYEVSVTAGGLQATLPVHVRFPRASGFISQIVLDEQDWESGSAVWNPSTGVVTVYIGRPEFKDAASKAKARGTTDPWKDTPYRQLIVESVREAALWEAAQRHAEVEWDELPYEERQESNAFHRLTKFQFQALDYALRAKLLKVFVEA
jgi:hypothetical protein